MPRHTKPNPSAEWPDFYLIVTTNKDAPLFYENGLLTRDGAIDLIYSGEQEDVLCVLWVNRHVGYEDCTESVLEDVAFKSYADSVEPFASLATLLDRYDVDYYRERDNERALRYVGRGLR